MSAADSPPRRSTFLADVAASLPPGARSPELFRLLLEDALDGALGVPGGDDTLRGRILGGDAAAVEAVVERHAGAVVIGAAIALAGAEVAAALDRLAAALAGAGPEGSA